MSLREWLDSQTGRVIAIAAACVAIVACALIAWRVLGPNPAASASSHRTFIDADNGKPFEYTVKAGDTLPVPSPFSGKRTGYPAEACYRTADGQIKETPTYVLLNVYKGIAGPTFCPDCGRLVIGHNPRPHPGDKPPPTRAEYQAAHRRSLP